MPTVTQCNPEANLGDILRTSTAPAPNKIRAALLLRGETLTSYALHLGRQRTLISRVIHGRDESAPLKQAIADDLGVDITDIWPVSSENKVSHGPILSEAE